MQWNRGEAEVGMDLWVPLVPWAAAGLPEQVDRVRVVSEDLQGRRLLTIPVTSHLTVGEVFPDVPLCFSALGKLHFCN